MGLTRIFVAAILGVLIPTAVVLYLLLAPTHSASARDRACEVAQSFVAEKVAPAKIVAFEACSDEKALQLKEGEWQVKGDVEVEKDAAATEHESYLVRLKLGENGASTLVTMSLR